MYHFACRMFGCNVVPTVLKLRFFESLVLSRLFYNIHTLAMTTRALRKLNFNYMRPLRRIAGVPRHSAATCTVSDAEVRRRLGVQSVDSKVLQYRMRYYARLVAHWPVTLWAVLQSRPGGAPLPRVKQTIKDLCFVRDSSDMCKSLLPDPAVDSSPWLQLMYDDPEEWANLCQRVAYSYSIFDDCKDVPAYAPAVAKPHVCQLCIGASAASFPTAQGLAQHMRITHRKRSIIHNFVDNSGVCPNCATNFVFRICVISHLSDTRPSRCRCRNAVLFGDIVPELSPEFVAKLNSRDREFKKQALREGHTHALAAASARTASGRRIGSVRA